jgi:putative ABC transport system permease protein
VTQLYSMSLSIPGADSPEIWKPFAATPQELRLFGSFNFACIARLAPGLSAGQALAMVNGVQSALASQVSGLADLRAVFTPFHDQLVERSRRGLEITLAAVGVVLLIACVNISNLLLARSMARQREVAIRGAIGATRRRLVRQMLVESVTLSGIAGLLGIGLAYGLVPVIMTYAPPDLPRLDEVELDVRVLAFAVVLSMIAGLLTGLVPALRSSGPTPGAASALRARASGPPAEHARAALVGIEIAATTMCLIVGGLLLTSFVRLLDVDPGFATKRVLSLNVYLPESRYRDNTSRRTFVGAVIERIRSLPGVVAAGASNNTPLTGGGGYGAVNVEGSTLPRPQRPRAEQRFVTPDYLSAAGIPLKNGRVFSHADEGRMVAVVASAAAAALWPGERPIGKRFAIGQDDAPLWFEVIGVVGDIRTTGLDQPSPLTIYVPEWIGVFPLVSLTIRTHTDGDATPAAIRDVLRQLDPELVIPPVRTMEEVVVASVAERRFQLGLVLLFAGLATLLAALGIYGVISHAVVERTKEFGIRVALGARTAQIRRVVLRQGMQPVGVGLAVGILGALAAGRFLSSMLFGVSITDPFTIAVVLVLLAGVATLAILVPAERAARLDPLVALRFE